MAIPTCHRTMGINNPGSKKRGPWQHRHSKWDSCSDPVWKNDLNWYTNTGSVRTAQRSGPNVDRGECQTNSELTCHCLLPTDQNQTEGPRYRSNHKQMRSKPMLLYSKTPTKGPKLPRYPLTPRLENQRHQVRYTSTLALNPPTHTHTHTHTQEKPITPHHKNGSPQGHRPTLPTRAQHSRDHDWPKGSSRTLSPSREKSRNHTRTSPIPLPLAQNRYIHPAKGHLTQTVKRQPNFRVQRQSTFFSQRQPTTPAQRRPAQWQPTYPAPKAAYLFCPKADYSCPHTVYLTCHKVNCPPIQTDHTHTHNHHTYTRRAQPSHQGTAYSSKWTRS